MADALLLPDQWDEVRRASEGGAKDEELIPIYFPWAKTETEKDRARNTIRKRRSRYNWATPARIARDSYMKKATDVGRRIGNGVLRNAPPTVPPAEQVLAERRAQLGEQGTTDVMELLTLVLQELKDRRAVGAPLGFKIESIKDLTMVGKSLHTLSGQEKAQGPIGLAPLYWGGGSGEKVANGVVIEMEED